MGDAMKRAMNLFDVRLSALECEIRWRPGFGVVRGWWTACWLGLAITAPMIAKGGSAQEFEVASVRQNKTNEAPTSSFSLDSGNVYSMVTKTDVFIPSGGYFSATNQPLWRYIVFAYKLTGTQELALRFNFFAGLTSKVPEWVTSERFDIKARVEGTPNKDQVRLMVQRLLTDRFGLVVHKETREAPVLALVAVKSGVLGPKLQAHKADESCASTTGTDGATGRSVTVGGLPEVCGVIAHLHPSLPGRVGFGGRDVNLGVFASSLPTQTGMATLPHPVVDRTGLGGTYDFALEWVPEAYGEGGQPDEAGPTFVKALREQLGLKLESQKGPIELVVIDHIERPSTN